ncbi:hypothetical protein V2J09_012750 [Rumex salicifolius]
MKQPPGFINREFPDHVCRLRKAIYGLKQAPRAWYTELRTFLIHQGFVNSISDTSLFILNRGSATLYILIYVDDIIVTGNTPASVDKVIATLASKFSLKDMGNLHYFLGVEVTRSTDGIFLNQRKYVHDLLTRAGMSEAKAANTPLLSLIPWLNPNLLELEKTEIGGAIINGGRIQGLGGCFSRGTMGS